MLPTSAPRIACVLSAIALFLGTTPLLADPRPIQVTAQFLDLSEQQLEQMALVRESLGQSLEPIQRQLVQRRAVLDQLLDSADPNPVEVGAVLISIHALGKEGSSLGQQAQDELRSLLDGEQLERLNEAASAALACRVLPALEATGLL